MERHTPTLSVAQATQLSSAGADARYGMYGPVATPFGEASWVTQYFFGYGRWGIYNVHTQLFYPQGDWFPVT